MKHALILTGVLTGLLAGSTAARAEAFIPGAELAKACAANSRESAACTGFIAGAMDEIETLPDVKAKLCIPAGTKLKTLRESLASYVQERPEAVKGSGAALLNAMVSSRYPCKP